MVGGRWWLGWLWLVGLPAAGWAEPLELLDDGQFAAVGEVWTIRGRARGEVVEGAVGEAPRFLRLTVDALPGAEPWSAALSQTVNEPLRQGQRLELSLWARSAEGMSLRVYLQYAKSPNTNSIYHEAKLTHDWQQITVRGTAVADYAARETQFGFHLATGTGTIELADIRLINLDVPGLDGQRPTLERPSNLVANGDFAEGAAGWIGPGERLTVEPVAVAVEGYTQGLRLTSRPEPGGEPWAVGFGQVTQAPCRRGDAVYFRAWLRSPESVPVDFVFEINAPPNFKEIHEQVRLTPEWQEYRFVGRCRQSYAPGEALAKLFLGRQPGTIEIAGLRCENYGPAWGHVFDTTVDYWSGRPHDDGWRAAAESRIARYRQGDLQVTVVDAAGQPVPGAAVAVRQQTHRFRFGTAAPAARLVVDSPDNRRFRDTLKELFNTVTFENDLKWTNENPAGLEQVDQALEWLAANGLEARGHCLVWGSRRFLPAAVRQLSGEALRAAITAHVTDYAKRFAGRLYLWDVVNEAGSNTEVWDEVGWDQFAEVFRLAREADPQALRCYNDYGILAQDSRDRERVAARIEQLLAAGAPVDVLGIQSHMGRPLTPMPEIWRQLERWAAFGPRIEITEFDLRLADDAAHAAWATDFLTLAFSHPQVDAFIMWGFWAGSHWRGDQGGAMINRDWSWRPAAEQFRQKVWHDWWTRWDGESDAAGQARLRAYYGQQQITVRAAGREATATVDLAPGAPGTVTVTLP